MEYMPFELKKYILLQSMHTGASSEYLNADNVDT